MIARDIQEKMPQIIMLLKKHQIKSAFLFGSVVTNKFSPASDVDFLVDIIENQEPAQAGEHLWDLGYGLENLLRRKVDLLTRSSLRNSVLINEIEKNKVSIYGQ